MILVRSTLSPLDSGEFLVANAITKEIKNQTKPNHPAMTVTGFRMYDCLQGKTKNKKGVVPVLSNLLRDSMFDGSTKLTTPFGSTEHDIVSVIPNNDKLEVIFGQVKTIENITDAVMKSKMSDALGQTRKDVEAFLKALPDICVTKTNFTTIAVLPASEKASSNLCSSCERIIVFRSDIWWVTCTRTPGPGGGKGKEGGKVGIGGGEKNRDKRKSRRKRQNKYF